MLLHAREECPSDDVGRCVHDALIDSPGDVVDGCVERQALREESHLCGWIDELVFQIGNTQSRHHTAEIQNDRDEI